MLDVWPALFYTSKLPVQSWTINYFCLFPMKPGDKTGFRAKKTFLMAILKFSDETRRRFFEPLDFTIHYNRTWKFAIRMLIISQFNLDLLTKTGFWRPFWIFKTKPEVVFLNQYFFLITTIEPENLPFKFWKYLN